MERGTSTYWIKNWEAEKKKKCNKAGNFHHRRYNRWATAELARPPEDHLRCAASDREIQSITRRRVGAFISIRLYLLR